MNEYKLHMFMVWHESANPAITIVMEQRGRSWMGPTKWHDQRSKKMTWQKDEKEKVWSRKQEVHE
jgi:hypothetical protein